MPRRIAVVAVVALPAVLFAQTTHEVGLGAYHRAIVLLETHRASVEQVFDRGLFVRDNLLKLDPHGTTVLESMSSGEFDEMKADFPGFVIGRDESVFINPDPAYFGRIAQQFGDAADRAFFDAYARTRPNGVWPAWIGQDGGASVCTRFGAGELVGAYQRWAEFRDAYPKRYRPAAEEFLDSIEYEVSSATCACGEQKSVLGELETFDRTFPQTRVSAVVRERIRELRENRSTIRFVCASGPASRIVR